MSRWGAGTDSTHPPFIAHCGRTLLDCSLNKHISVADRQTDRHTEALFHSHNRERWKLQPRTFCSGYGRWVRERIGHLNRCISALSITARPATARRVIICTAYFNIQNFFILSTQCIYEFYELLTSKIIIAPRNRRQALFLNKVKNLYCQSWNWLQHKNNISTGMHTFVTPGRPWSINFIQLRLAFLSPQYGIFEIWVCS